MLIRCPEVPEIMFRLWLSTAHEQRSHYLQFDFVKRNTTVALQYRNKHWEKSKSSISQHALSY